MIQFDQVIGVFMRLYLRLWQSIENPLYSKILFMVRTEIKFGLRQAVLSTVEKLEKSVLLAPISNIIQRSIKEMEEEDEVINHPVVR
jgi:hypothetical protein